MTDTNTLAPADAEILDAPDLLQIARSTGLRSHLQGVSATDARELLKAFVDALPPTPVSQPAAVPASGPVGFDHKTAANFLNGKPVADDEMRRFVACSRWAHDDRDGLRNTIADLRREIAQRDAEIALLKTSLLDDESPTQAAQAQDPRFCYRSHPHEHQDTHCQLREVAAWLRWHAAAGKTPSAESMRAHAEQVDAVALELRSAPAGMEPVAWLIERSAFHVSPHGQDAEGNEWLEEAQSPEEPGAFAVFTATQVQAMLSQGLAPEWKAVPVAWLHDCAALLTNDVELWIDACPHCGKPRNAPQPVEREPLTCAEVQKIVIEVCDAIYPQDDVSYSEADTVFYGAFVRAIEAAHGITYKQGAKS